MSDEERADARRHVRALRSLMLSLTFAGGALFGLLAGSLGLPGVWSVPAVLAVTGVFWLAVLRG